MAIYKGRLYAIPLYSQGVFRYDGGSTWTHCGGPGKRMMSLAVFDGYLYGAGNEGEGRGGVYRYEGGTEWSNAGNQEGVTQVYSFAIHNGQMYVGTWPEGKVFRDDGEPMWTDVGRLGEEREVMAMAVFNGKLYAGTLPLGQVYRYDGATRWTLTGQLDKTPDVKYRRVWSMAAFNGKLYAGTLPSGRVYSLEAGKSVTCDHELAPGWRHLAAIRDGNKLKLYVDGALAATSSAFNPADYTLSNDKPLKIGSGQHKHLQRQNPGSAHLQPRVDRSGNHRAQRPEGLNVRGSCGVAIHTTCNGGVILEPTCLDYSMTDAQRDHFDQQGYLIVEDALDSKMVGCLQEAADRVDAQERKNRAIAPNEIMAKFRTIIEEDIFLELLDWPRTFPLIWDILGWNVQPLHFAPDLLSAKAEAGRSP